MVGFGLFILVFLFAVVAPFVLYYFVRAERDQREAMDRETAERTVRQDTDNHE